MSNACEHDPAKATRDYVEAFNKYKELMDKYMPTGANGVRTFIPTVESLQELEEAEAELAEKHKIFNQAIGGQ